YEFNKDRLSIVDAIAMAGDLTTNGQRENIIVLREVDGGNSQAYKIDLTDMRSISESPVYYLQQNDVIYVEPNDKKKRDTTASGNSAFNPSFWVSIGSLGVTIATLIITLTR
ncbi:MAG: polysaccharide export protein, partial [Muribaculaceae bacterium]|nr:polysaccharide export protein [Muribaculaceae bacterium]